MKIKIQIAPDCSQILKALMQKYNKTETEVIENAIWCLALHYQPNVRCSVNHTEEEKPICKDN